MGLDGAEYSSKAWADAHSAFLPLECLMSKKAEHTQLTNKVQAVLLRMQAEPRLCKLLQPCIPGWLRSVEFEWGASKSLQRYKLRCAVQLLQPCMFGGLQSMEI